MEVTLLLLSIALCFALTMAQVPVAPEDVQTICRTSFQYREAHDWIPYVNDTSNGVRGEVKWQVLLDQFDYQNLIGANTIPPSPWEVRDFDGDGVQFRTTGGGNCLFSIGVTGTSYRNPNTNNWVFTQSVNFLDAIEVYVNASVRFVGCHQRANQNPPCLKNFVTLHRYDTNSPTTVDQRTNPANYQPYLGDAVRSRLEQNDGDSGRIVMTYLRPQNFNFTHFGIQDSGTYGIVERLLVYYKVAQGYEDGLVVCPSVALPAEGSGEMNTKNCMCKANSTATASLVRTCDENGVCQESPACECNPGYEYNDTLKICQGCRMGTYKTSLSSTDRCIPCPGNSMTINDSAIVCDCIRGTVRCPSRPDDVCQTFEDFFANTIDCEDSSEGRGSDGGGGGVGGGGVGGGGVSAAGGIAITFFVTLIITAVITALVVFIVLYILWKK